MQGPPDSQARSPMHMIPFEVLLVLEVEFVWYELEMENSPANAGTDGKIPLGTWDQVCFHCRADSRHWVSAQQLGQRTSQLSRSTQPSPGWFHTENSLGELWNLGMNRDLWDIYVCTSGASSSKDVGFLMPATFLIFWKLNNVFSWGSYYFSFCFVLYFKYFS